MTTVVNIPAFMAMRTPTTITPPATATTRPSSERDDNTDLSARTRWPNRMVTKALIFFEIRR